MFAVARLPRATENRSENSIAVEFTGKFNQVRKQYLDVPKNLYKTNLPALQS